MKTRFLLPCVASILLVGCFSAKTKERMSESFQDSFLFTSASSVPKKNLTCIKLKKAYSYKSGSYTYMIPAGTYVGRKQNKTGIFYYSKTSIKPTNASILSFATRFDGLFLDNNANNGKLFFHNPQGYADRPIRGDVLPKEILQNIQRNVQCN